MSAFGDRLWDDEIFGPPGTARPEPQVVSQLLNNLGLSRASKAEKEQASKTGSPHTGRVPA